MIVQLLELMGSLFKVSCNINYDSNNKKSKKNVACISQIYLTEDNFKSMALSLVKASSLPISEIVVSSMSSIGCIGQRDISVLYHPSINVLVTNSILRRLVDSNGYSYYDGIVADNNRNMNLYISSLRIIDNCFNAIIDLHSSDDLGYLENFKKLKCIEKLRNQHSYFFEMIQKKLFPIDDNDLEKFQETLENIDSFIQYKQEFCK